MLGSSINPFDTLLVNQLEALIKGENELRAQYSSFDAAASTPEARHEFTERLSVLRDRADRLNRLLDAMNFHGLATPALAA